MEGAMTAGSRWLEKARAQARTIAYNHGPEELIEPKEFEQDRLERFLDAENTIAQSGKTSLTNCQRSEGSPIFVPIKDAAIGHRELVEGLLEVLESDGVRSAANLACFEAGVLLCMPEGKRGTFRHVLITDANLADRSVVICKRGSDATLIVDSRSISSAPSRRNGHLRVRLEERSSLTLIEIQRPCDRTESTVLTAAEIGEGARLTHLTATLGGAATDKTNIFKITGHGGQVVHRHVTLAAGNESHTTETVAIHEGRCSRSDISSRSVADGNASVASHSKVHIDAAAQKSASRAEDHSMIVSRGARCESVPSMEILADDVEAGHGASTCHLDPEHMFYLQSRGLDAHEAKKQIVTGFLKSIFIDETSSAGAVCFSDLISDRFDSAGRDHLAAGINRKEFPILAQKVNGKPLAYLDNAATTQKPKAVMESISRFYSRDNANINRGIHTLGERATAAFESARKKVARFINAKPNEIIFVRNATEGINLIANTIARKKLLPSDRILLTEMEHHSNIVPWQMACAETKSMIDAVEVTPEGLLDAESLRRCLAQNPKIFSFTHVSNVLGTINPVKELVQMAHRAGAMAVVDGAQSAPHISIDVKDLDCDVFVFSGHKMLGPTGIGVVYIKHGLMSEMPPFLGGGGMIKEVTFGKVSFKNGPERFEAGTPDICGAVGLAAAIDYLEGVGMENVKAHNDALVRYALEKLSEIRQVRIYGPQDPSKRAGVISFNLGDMHAHDVSTVLDEQGVAIRAGHLCAQPLMARMDTASMCRASFHIYNSTRDVDQLIESIKKAIKVFRL